MAAELFPHPPQPRTTADFVVLVFVVTVASILVLFTVGIIVASIAGRDVSAYASTLIDMTTTIIGALIGFIAGKGSAKVE